MFNPGPAKERDLLFLYPVKQIPREAVLWLVALLVLALTDPCVAGHFTLCPLAQAGATFCPGCGLGRSITLLFHGDFAASWNIHPLGIFAVIVLSYRIVSLFLNALKPYGKSN
ncbi:MAG: DUF2752 domain-containing protein [Flammeovirgaceae bacterium]|nr:MAG: DUF2752 domain-containing protein [Flammeovirgaceae bacterium]